LSRPDRFNMPKRTPTRIVTGLVVGVALAAAAPHAQEAAPTRIVLLGTGTPNATPDRWGPALAIVVGDTPYLVDAGVGIVRRAEAARAKGVEALRASNLRRVFVTHLHSDHTLGYPDLILSPWTVGRDVPLEAYGPPGLEAMTQHLLAAYREDIDIRLEGGEPSNPDGWKVNVHEIEPGLVYKDDLVTVEAFAVPHGQWAHAFGYKFTTPDGVVVLSGDTGPFDGMAGIAKGADVLIHEAYATAGWEGRDDAWREYHAAYHTPGRMVGETATKAGVPTVILTHQLWWSASEEQLVEEVRSTFAGRVISGKDLDVFDLREMARR